MAWPVTERGYNENWATSSGLVISSFTPTADCLLLALIGYDNTASISSISGQDSGSSWVQISSHGANGGWPGTQSGFDFDIWGCFTTTGTPSAGTVTINKSGYMAVCSAVIVEVHEDSNGVDTSGTVANAMGTHVADDGYNPSPLSITLASFADSNNLSFCTGVCYANSGSFSFPGTPSWTAMTERNEDMRIHPAYYAGEDTSISVTCGAWIHAGIVGFEVKQAAGGGPYSESRAGSMRASGAISKLLDMKRAVNGNFMEMINKYKYRKQNGLLIAEPNIIHV